MKSFAGHLHGAVLCVAALASGNAQALSDAEVDKLFNDALLQSQSGDIGSAISAYESILSELPNAGRVRLELALANYRALNYAAARGHAQQVLADPNTPDSVRRTVQAFLDQIKNRDRKHALTPYLSLGWIHDNNVNAGPDSSVIDIGAAVVTLAAGSKPREADGMQLSTGMNHQYLFDNTMSIAGDQAAVAWLSQASLFRNQYFGENDFHLNVISFRTGPTLLAARKWRLRLDGEFNHISIGDHDIAMYGGFNPALSFFIGNQITLTVSGQVQIRRFDRGSDEDRESEYYAGGGSIGYQFENFPVAIRAGFSGFTEDANASRRSNDGWIATAGITMRPLAGTNVYFNYFHRDREYDGSEPIFLVKRDENEDRFVAGASYRLPRLGSFEGLTVNFSYTNTDNDSNVALFRTERDQFLLSLSKTF